MIEATPEQEAARAKWVTEVCQYMAKQFNFEPGGNGMAMVRMMAEVSALGLFCQCGSPASSPCFDCIEKGYPRDKGTVPG